MKRIVLFVEGGGEAVAVPKLIARLLSEQEAYDAVFWDDHPFRVGEVSRLVKDDFREWKRKLGAALKRSELGGVILLLDGDIRQVEGKVFCAAEVAKKLADKANEVGASSLFSVAVVFACQEYESWFIAGIQSLAGTSFPDGRKGISAEILPPDGDLEANPRNAKGWLSSVMAGGYKPTRDQVIFTQMLDWQLVRDRPMRSFLRLESAVRETVTAIRMNEHVSTPC